MTQGEVVDLPVGSGIGGLNCSDPAYSDAVAVKIRLDRLQGIKRQRVGFAERAFRSGSGLFTCHHGGVVQKTDVEMRQRLNGFGLLGERVEQTVEPRKNSVKTS